MILVLRSAVFTVWMYVTLFLFGFGCIPLLAFPGGAHWAIRNWAKGILWGLRVFCGMRVVVRGREYLPTGAALIASKHQGELDGIAPLALLDDPCFVLKRELMKVPVVGWYAGGSGMIPVDRSGGSRTIKALGAMAAQRLSEARQLLIFPEGTRQEPGAPPKYKSGVSALYRDLAIPCVPVATNSGLFWPPRGLLRHPGTCVYEFLPPIQPGLARQAFMAELEKRIETATNALVAQGR